MTDYIDHYGNTIDIKPTDSVNEVQEIMAEPVDERYKLSIYPDGFDDRKPNNGEVHLIFDDKESWKWDEYKVKEWTFCLDEYNAYLIAPHKDKLRMRDEFYAKRVLFAKQNNFVPKKGNKKEWMKQDIINDDKVLA